MYLKSILLVDDEPNNRVVSAALRHIPVIALTAHPLAEERDRERAEAAGFDGYLNKPIEPHVVFEEPQRRIGPP